MQRSAANCIQFMFNVFDPERLQGAVGAERCAFGMNFVQATLDGDGRLKANIGAGNQKTLMDQQRWVDLFSAAGLPAALEREMPLWLRDHVPLCVAFESVSIAGVRRGKGASWREALVLARGVDAAFGLIIGLGYPIYPRWKQPMSRSPLSAVAAMLWSMSRIRSFRELLAAGKAECIVLVDEMVASLAKKTVAVSAIVRHKGMCSLHCSPLINRLGDWWKSDVPRTVVDQRPDNNVKCCMTARQLKPGHTGIFSQPRPIVTPVRYNRHSMNFRFVAVASERQFATG